MVTINKIKISGFRNLSDVEIEIKDITSLLSINSYGKTNYLNGIIFGLDFIHAPSRVKDIMMNYDSYKPYNKKILLKDFAFEMDLSIIENDIEYQVIYGYSFEWNRNENKNSKIISEYLKIKDNTSQKFASFIKRDKDGITYKSSVTGSCNRNINVDSNDLIINKMMAYDDLFYFNLIKTINGVQVYVDRHFSTSKLYSAQTRVKKTYSDYYLGEDANVPEILFNLKNDYPNKFILIINTIKDIFPFISDIKTLEYNISGNNNSKVEDYIPADNVYFLVAYDKNIVKSINFSDMSDGVKRVLLIFTTLVLADINNYSLVGIEEPENSLNPRILQRYLIALKEFSKNTKIIITSHSPYLINYMDPQNIYIGIPNNDGLANFSKIKEKSSFKLLNDAKNMDMLVGDYIFDLMSGSSDDLEVLAKYVE